MNELSGKEKTSEVKVEGIGKVSTYGSLNVEKLVKRLLQSKYITG